MGTTTCATGTPVEADSAAEPALTVLAVVTDGWRWRVEPDDREPLPAPHDAPRQDLMTEGVLVLASVWKRLLFS